MCVNKNKCCPLHIVSWLFQINVKINLLIYINVNKNFEPPCNTKVYARSRAIVTVDQFLSSRQCSFVMCHCFFWFFAVHVVLRFVFVKFVSMTHYKATQPHSYVYSILRTYHTVTMNIKPGWVGGITKVGETMTSLGKMTAHGFMALRLGELLSEQ